MCSFCQVQLPPLFNIPKSQLQCFGESAYCFSKNLLQQCNNAENSLDRFTSVVAWSISTTRSPSFGVAPYNPILGETHHVSRGSLNVLLEQVLKILVRSDGLGLYNRGGIISYDWILLIHGFRCPIIHQFQPSTRRTRKKILSWFGANNLFQNSMVGLLFPNCFSLLLGNMDFGFLNDLATWFYFSLIVKAQE